MAVDAKKIFIGLPDQATTGAILTAPVGTALPTSAVDTLNVAFKDSGYVTEDGVNVSPPSLWGACFRRRGLGSSR